MSDKAENASVPLSRLEELRRALDFRDPELELIRRHGEAFVRRAGDFSALLHSSFAELPETRIILEHEERPQFLRRAWANWFERLFTAEWDGPFLGYLWHIGTRHVEVNLDQRYSNLAFSLARRFCHGVVTQAVPAEERAALTLALDKMLDFCLLVETTAYIEATTACDLEVIKGVADRVRTPATIIGGNVKRLQRRSSPDATLSEVYETLVAENQRLERMVEDIEAYAVVHERQPEFTEFSVDGMLRRAWERVRGREKLERVRLEIEIEPSGERVFADSRDCQLLFTCLLQNSLDAADGPEPAISVRSRAVPGLVPNVEVSLFNTGTPPSPEELELMMAPFYSTKSFGTGFGLSIARLAVRKNFGKLRIEPVPGEGTRVCVVLPCRNERVAAPDPEASPPPTG